VQTAVDRRFNRARYDADTAITAFAAHLRDAVELDAIRAGLLQAVHAALEPAHVSVWISQRDGRCSALDRRERGLGPQPPAQAGHAMLARAASRVPTGPSCPRLARFAPNRA